MRTSGPTEGPFSAQGAGRGKHPRAGALGSEGELQARPGSAGKAAPTLGVKGPGAAQRGARGPEPAAAPTSARNGASPKAGTASALAALRAEGLPRAQGKLGEGPALTLAVERIRSAALLEPSASSASAGPREAMRIASRLALAARAEAKGIMASRDFVDAVEFLSGDPLAREEGASLLEGIEWDGGSGGGGGSAPGGSDEGSGSDRRSLEEEPRSPGEGPETAADRAAGLSLDPASLDLDSALALEIPENDLPRELGALIQALVFRSGTEGTSLNLFNHSLSPGGLRDGAPDGDTSGVPEGPPEGPPFGPPEGRWIYAPIRFSLDSVAFSGTIRIQLPKAKGGPFRAEARFLARRGDREGEWSFSLVAGLGASRVRLSAARDETGRKARAAERAFALELSRFACSFRLVDAGEIGDGPGVDLRA